MRIVDVCFKETLGEAENLFNVMSEERRVDNDRRDLTIQLDDHELDKATNEFHLEDERRRRNIGERFSLL